MGPGSGPRARGGKNPPRALKNLFSPHKPRPRHPKRLFISVGAPPGGTQGRPPGEAPPGGFPSPLKAANALFGFPPRPAKKGRRPPAPPPLGKGGNRAPTPGSSRRPVGFGEILAKAGLTVLGERGKKGQKGKPAPQRARGKGGWGPCGGKTSPFFCRGFK